ncbi:MAG: EAL domain-containing protein [Nitrospirota bacterium]
MDPRRKKKCELVAATEELRCRLARAEEELHRARSIAQASSEAARYRAGDTLRALAQASPLAIIVLDRNGDVLMWSPAAEQLFGWSGQEVLGRPLPIIPEDQRAHYLESIRQQFRGISHSGVELRRLRKNGTLIDVCLWTAPLRDEGGEVIGLVGMIADITERKRTEEALRASEARLTIITRNAPGYIMQLDRNGTIIYMNRTASGCEMSEVIGSCFFDWVPAHSRHLARAALAAVFDTGNSREYEIEGADPNGELRWYRVHIAPVPTDSLILSAIAVATDITENKRAEEAIRYQAYHDLLTGLPNRMLLMDHLDRAILQAHRDRTRLAVMFMDIDRFKSINDTLGHDAGDRLLKEVAARLRPCIRESDTIGRIGGDEFTILLPQVAQAEDAAKIATKVLAAFEKFFILGGQELHVTPSIGISMYPDDGEYAETLLKNADIAMYHAKEQGRNNYQFYNPVMNVATLERMILENSLRQTLKRGELSVHYLPQVSIDTRQLIGVEALVRWKHPELGLIDPFRFIPLAEETGFIVTMDEWVLRTACAERRSWDEAGYPPLTITVNLSARQFLQANLAEVVFRTLQETGLEPRWLALEVAEGTVMEDCGAAMPALEELTAAGVRLSIDDFGTGLSSVSCLKRLPVHTIKIDRSLVRGLPGDSGDQAVVGAIVAMAHSLKLKVVAEGVETEEQLAALLESGCDGMQGYLFSEAVDAEELRALISLYR